MKPFLLLFLLALSLAPAALAQSEPQVTRTSRAERMLDRRLALLDERLTLTDSQEARIRQIFVRERERLRARAEATRAEDRTRHEAERADPEALKRHREQERERMRASWEALDREIRRVLGSRQRRLYDELRREEVQRFEERMRERATDRPDGHRTESRVLVIRRPNGH